MHLHYIAEQLSGRMATAMEGAAPSAGADEKSQRVRNLLTSYYGNNADLPEGLSDTSRAPRHQAGGLDSASFDADRYLSQLLRTARLRALMQKAH